MGGEKEGEKRKNTGGKEEINKFVCLFVFLLLISEVLLIAQITHLGDRRPMRCREPGLDIHMEK